MADSLFKLARLLLWGQAVFAFRIAQRVWNVLLGRAVFRIIRRFYL